MTLDEAEALAARVLAAIDNNMQHSCLECPELIPYIRERVASDLAGLLWHEDCDQCVVYGADTCEDRKRDTDNLRRTAALCDVS